jgi:hypothetical protein
VAEVDATVGEGTLAFLSIVQLCSSRQEGLAHSDTACVQISVKRAAQHILVKSNGESALRSATSGRLLWTRRS